MKKKMSGAAAMLLALGMAGCAAQGEMPLNELKVEKYVTLGDYKNLAVSVEEPYSVTEEECVYMLASIYAGYATEELGAVDRAVMMGDTVNIDYEGKLDGVAFEGGTAQGTNLTIGSGQFIDGFEDGLVGAVTGETRDLTLTFPEGYQSADLAGKETVFTVTVNYVIPGNEEEMLDAVVEAMETGDVELNTVAELKQYIRESLEEEAQYYYENELMDGILTELTAQSVFEELPPYLIENGREMLQKNLNGLAAQYGVTAEDYALYYFGMGAEDFINANVEDMVRRDIAVQAVANAEGLKVTDEELDAKLQEEAEANGYASVEELIGDEDKENYRNYFMNEKVMDFLMENVK